MSFKTSLATRSSSMPTVCRVFGCTGHKIETRWKDRGGWSGYGEHVHSVGDRFDHVTVHPDVWSKARPTSSMPAHIFLSAVAVMEHKGQVSEGGAGGAVRRASWAVREAFFAELADISSRSVLLDIAQRLNYPVPQLVALMDSGEAHARLCQDHLLAQEYDVRVSPALVFNEGRQRLIGNVGYRIIEANVRELLNDSGEQKSWC